MRIRDAVDAARATVRALALSMVLVLVLAATPGAPARAAVPGEVDFQGLLFDTAGQRVNGSVDLDFALFATATGGTALWSESHTGVSVLDGVYQVRLGSVVSLTQDVLAGGTLHLEVTVDGDTLAPRQPLVAVPYALRASHAESTNAVTAPSEQVPATNGIEVVDAGGPAGLQVAGTAITIGADGLPVLAYSVDASTGSSEGLRVLRCANASCSEVESIAEIAPGNETRFPSLAIGTDGLPLVAFYTRGLIEVRLKKCVTADCGSPGSGFSLSAREGCPSVAVGLDGLPLVSYVAGNGDVRLARCATTDCGGPPATVLIDSTTNFECTSLAIGLDGRPYVLYSTDDGDDELKIARCGDAACTTVATELLDSVSTVTGRLLAPSLTIGRDGLPVASYLRALDEFSDFELRAARCTSADCQTRTNATIDSVGPFALHEYSSGSRTAIRLGSGGNPVVAYPSKTSAPSIGLDFALCADPGCSSTLVQLAVDQPPPDDTGTFPSMTVGADGRPYIVYRDERGPGLKLMRCANPYCLPNWTRP